MTAQYTRVHYDLTMQTDRTFLKLNILLMKIPSNESVLSSVVDINDTKENILHGRSTVEIHIS